jgi:predicted transcriptional regulator
MDFPPLSSIGKRRKALGRTQAELARLCEIGQSFVAKIERGEAMPSYAIAVKLFETLENLEARHSERLSNMQAKDIMTRKVVTVTPKDRAEDARKIMLERNVSQLPVVDGGKSGGLPEGSITEKSLLGKEIAGRTVREVMDRDVFPAVTPYTRLSVVTSILREHEQAVLVVERAKIVGIITKYDVLSHAK